MRKVVFTLSILLIVLITLIAPTIVRATPSSSTSWTNPAPTQPSLRLFYAGPQDGVSRALHLAQFQITDQISTADVLVFNGLIPDPAAAAARMAGGADLVLILGPEIQAGDVSTLLGVPVELQRTETPISLVNAPGASHPLLEQIIWNSAPQVRQRSVVVVPLSSPIPLVTGYEDHSWLLWTWQQNRTNIYVLDAHLGEANPQFQEWAYFNYLIYALVVHANQGTALSFAAYPASPVPHTAERVAILAILIAILATAFIIFFFVRRYSLAHPELLDSLVVDRQEFEERQAHTDWEEVGFHRPLGGFMFSLMLGLLLFIPLIIYQNLILPVYILPSAQALGIWGRVIQFFNFLWLFFDMGTSAAFIKFFSEYRVHDPRKAIQYGQVFIWWQALSGAAQVAVVTIIASVILPETPYALYAWSIIIHTAIQLPGFYQVMRHALKAWQRFDYSQVIDIGIYVFLPILVQPVLVAVMVAWGKAHPVFGLAMGGLLGLGLAAYVIEAIAFIIGIWLYRRLGYNARLLFLAHFDWATLKSSFRFGVFEMLGSFAWAIGQAVEILITQTRLVNYTEVWGNWGLAQNFIFAFQALDPLFSNLMPSISEAISNARRALSQYYAAMAYKYGGMVSAFIGAVLLAVADRFILGASGPEFVRAAAYAIPLIIWGAIQYPSWVGDYVQLASNRPYLKSILVASEQLIRIILAFLLVERFQINALILAYFIGLLSKGIAAFWLNHRLCFPQRFYIWQSLSAPLLAGAAHYLVLRWLTGLIWQQDQVTSVLIFLIGILFSYPLFAFFYGLAGGWDDDTLAELHHACKLSAFMRPLAWLFWAASAMGARFSPLHNRFPIDLRPAAMAEAQSLTRERVMV